MVWVKVEENFPYHPKTAKLARILNISKREVIGIVTWMWCWALKFAPDGDLTHLDPFSMEREVGWEGDSGFLCDALIECGFLDHDGQNLSVHDFFERTQHLYRTKEAQRKREYREAKKSVPVTSRGQKQMSQGQDRDVPSMSTSSPAPRVESREKRVDLLQDLITPCGAEKKSNSKWRAEVDSVYMHWRTFHPRSAPQLASSSKEYRLIKQALDSGFSPEECCEAISGYHKSPWHQGLNDRKRKYLSLDLIFRDQTHVTQGREMLDDPLITSLKSEDEMRQDIAIAKWANGQNE